MSSNILSSEKFVIIADIHNEFEIAEKIIKKEKPDQLYFWEIILIIFMILTRTLQILQDGLTNHCKYKTESSDGNHDLSYMTDTQISVLWVCRENMTDKQQSIWGN